MRKLENLTEVKRDKKAMSNKTSELVYMDDRTSIGRDSEKTNFNKSLGNYGEA